CDGQNHARGHIGRPEAHLPITQCRVYDVDLRHADAPSSASPGFTRNKGCPNSTSSPFCTHRSTMTPRKSDFTAVNTFITSMSPTVVSSVTALPSLAQGSAPGSRAM